MIIFRTLGVEKHPKAKMCSQPAELVEIPEVKGVSVLPSGLQFEFKAQNWNLKKKKVKCFPFFSLNTHNHAVDVMSSTTF